VLHDGRLLLERQYGVADLEAGTRVTPGSVFQVASLTKQFTAAAIMLLVEDGRIRLDSPLSAYLQSAPPAWSGVTIRHLLTHTSGLPPGAIVRVDASGNLTVREGTPLYDITARRALEVLSRMPVLFPPGARAMYCDACYFLLGLAIESASGMPYSRFMKTRIFDALGMAHSSIEDRWELVPGLVPVYTIRDGKHAPWRRDWQYEVNAFAGVRSTIGDLALWDRALRSGTLLNRGSLDAMWTPAKLATGRDALVFGDPYGFGWTLGELRGHRTVEHAGASGTFILRVKDSGLTVVVLTNLDGPGGSQAASIARAIAGLASPALRSVDAMPASSDPSPATGAELKRFLADLSEGRESPFMTDAHRDYYLEIPAPVRAGDAQLLKSLSNFAFIAADSVRGQGLTRFGDPVARIAYYRGDLGARAFSFTFWLTPDGKIAYVRFTPRT
jgi:D-alanyl-D-alanine carboxypeptidase